MSLVNMPIVQNVLDPDIRVLADSMELPKGAKYQQLITAEEADLDIGLRTGQSFRIVNRGANAFNLQLPNNSTEIIVPGETVMVSWDSKTETHIVQSVIRPSARPAPAGVGGPIPTPLDFDGVGNGQPENADRDTAAIQQCLDQGACYLPKGRHWVINESLDIKIPGTVIRGEGHDSIIQQVKSNRNIFQNAGSKEINGISIRGVFGIGKGTEQVLDFTVCNFIYLHGVHNFDVTHCIGRGFTNSGVQMRNSSNGTIANNLFYGFVWQPKKKDDDNEGAEEVKELGHASAAEILGWEGNARISVTNNICLSNNSQNIYFSGNKPDQKISITGNICDTLGDDLKPLDADEIVKRHSICSYQTSKQQSYKMVIANNICANTNWTGIYVQNRGQGVNIVGNYCVNNCQNDGGERLGGGIHVGHAVNECHVIGNIIQDCGGNQTSGSITVQPKDSDRKGIVVRGNLIVRGTAAGILLRLGPHRCAIENNVILDPANHGILLEAKNTATQVGDLSLRNNSIYIDGKYHAVMLFPKNSNKWIIIENNTFIQKSPSEDTFDTRNHSACYSRSSGVIFKYNFVKGFDAGYFQERDNVTTKGPIIDDNIFDNCQNGIIVLGDNSSRKVPVCFNTFVDCTHRVRNPIAAIVFEAMRRGDRLTIFSNEKPSRTDWQDGDRWENLNPAANSIPYWIWMNSRWVPASSLESKCICVEGEPTTATQGASSITLVNSEPTEVKGFASQVEGEQLTVVFDAKTTLLHDAQPASPDFLRLKLAGAINITGSRHQSAIRLQHIDGRWYQVSDVVHF